MNSPIVDPFTLPSLPLANRSELPNCPAIYFVLNADAVLYIGRANNLYQRWVAHHRWNQLKIISENIRIAWLECSASELLPEMEAALIQHFKPFLNWTKVEGWARPRATIYFSEEIYRYLVERADRELRTVANLVEYLVVQTVHQQQSEQQKPQQKPQE